MDCVCSAHKGYNKCMKCQEDGQGWPHPLFIATQVNRVVVPLGAVCAGAPDTAVAHRPWGGGAPRVRWSPDMAWRWHHPGGGSDHPSQVPEITVSRKIGWCTVVTMAVTSLAYAHLWRKMAVAPDKSDGAHGGVPPCLGRSTPSCLVTTPNLLLSAKSLWAPP